MCPRKLENFEGWLCGVLLCFLIDMWGPGMPIGFLVCISVLGVVLVKQGVLVGPRQSGVAAQCEGLSACLISSAA